MDAEGRWAPLRAHALVSRADVDDVEDLFAARRRRVPSRGGAAPGTLAARSAQLAAEQGRTTAAAQAAVTIPPPRRAEATPPRPQRAPLQPSPLRGASPIWASPKRTSSTDAAASGCQPIATPVSMQAWPPSNHRSPLVGTPLGASPSPVARVAMLAGSPMPRALSVGSLQGSAPRQDLVRSLAQGGTPRVAARQARRGGDARRAAACRAAGRLCHALEEDGLRLCLSGWALAVARDRAVRSRGDGQEPSGQAADELRAEAERWRLEAALAQARSEQAESELLRRSSGEFARLRALEDELMCLQQEAPGRIASSRAAICPGCRSVPSAGSKPGAAEAAATKAWRRAARGATASLADTMERLWLRLALQAWGTQAHIGHLTRVVLEQSAMADRAACCSRVIFTWRLAVESRHLASEVGRLAGAAAGRQGLALEALRLRTALRAWRHAAEGPAEPCQGTPQRRKGGRVGAGAADADGISPMSAGCEMGLATYCSAVVLSPLEELSSTPTSELGDAPETSLVAPPWPARPGERAGLTAPLQELELALPDPSRLGEANRQRWAEGLWVRPECRDGAGRAPEDGAPED